MSAASAASAGSMESGPSTPFWHSTRTTALVRGSIGRGEHLPGVSLFDIIVKH